MKLETAKKLLEENLRIYNQIAHDFSRVREGKLQELEPLAQLVKDGDRILDVGAGSGRLFELFKNRRIEYLGIDQSTEMIKICKEKFANYPHARFEAGDLLNLKFPNNSFDGIYIVATLHHLPSRELRIQALQKFHRMLKPCGKLIMTNWYWWRLPAILLIFKIWFKSWFKKILYALVHYSNVLKNIRIAKNQRLSNLLQYSHILKNMRILADLDFGDIFMPWGRVGLRYYHSFRKKELKKLLREAGFKNINQHLARKHGDHWGKRVNLVTIAEK